MHSLAFGTNLQPRFTTLRIFIRWRVQSYPPRQVALVYIAILLASARKRALMLNRKGCEAAAEDNVILCASLFHHRGEVAERLKAAVC